MARLKPKCSEPVSTSGGSKTPMRDRLLRPVVGTLVVTSMLLMAYDRMGEPTSLADKPLVSMSIFSLPSDKSSTTEFHQSTQDLPNVDEQIALEMAQVSQAPSQTELELTEQLVVLTTKTVKEKLDASNLSADAIEGDDLDTASQLMVLGRELSGRNEHAKALAFFEKAKNIYERFGDDAGMAQSYEKMADSINSSFASDLDKVDSYYKEALWNLKRIGDRQSEARINQKIAEQLINNGDLDEAQRHYEDALNYYQDNESTEQMAMIYANQCNIHILNNRFEQAKQACNAAMQIYQQLGDDLGIKVITQYLSFIRELDEG